MSALAHNIGLMPPPHLQEEITPPLAVGELSLTLRQRVVLDQVGVEVGRGEVVGLLGPNGCGKSSLLRCICGVWKADVGTVRIHGEVLTPKRRDLRARVGMVFQEPSLDPHLTALQNLRLGAGLFGVRGAEAQERASELLHFMELEDRASQLVKELSGGMRRRLEIARALIHRPEILLLDEPTTGLDPVAFQKVWRLIAGLRKAQQMSLLVSTHRSEEAEKCDRLVVLDRGHVVANDRPQNLLTRVAGDVVTVEADRPEELLTAFANTFELPVRLEGGALLLEVERGHEFVPRLVEAFPSGRFRSVQIRKPTLADAFYHLTGHALDQAPTSAEEAG